MARSRPDVLVVGAGIGGLTAAAHLARAGLDVTVVEKNGQAGGRCGRFTRDGHVFDTGPTLFVLPELYRAELSELGIRMDDALDLRPVDPTYRLVFDDGTALRLTSDMDVMRAQLEEMESGSFGRLLDYLDHGRGCYERAMEGFVRRGFRSVVDMCFATGPRGLAGLRLLRRHWNDAGRHFDSPRLRAAFTFQDLYLGMSPEDAPGTFSMLPFSELSHGVWFPVGGMYRVTEVLQRAAVEAGVAFRYHAAVRAMEVESRRVGRVVLEDGTVLRPGAVIANADLPYVEEQLLTPAVLARPPLRRRFSTSCVSFFWGVDGELDALGPHTLFLPDDFERGLREIDDGQALSDHPCFYVHAPARIDSGMAPPGSETLVALVPAGHLRPGRSYDWVAVRERARRHVLDGLARMGIVGLESRLKFEVCYLPPSWHRRYNLARGAAHGLGHQVTQLGALRPRNRHPRVRNLYFAGASTHPGSGVPTAMVSGRLAAARLLGDRAPVHDNAETPEIEASSLQGFESVPAGP